VTTTELADTYERISFALRKYPCNIGVPRPAVRGEALVGAALFWTYLRDLFTVTPKEQFTRDEILVILDAVQTDGDLAIPGAIKQIADSWDEDAQS
jgi:hypothetical protein